jgi:hypothetical protein
MADDRCPIDPNTLLCAMCDQPANAHPPSLCSLQQKALVEQVNFLTAEVRLLRRRIAEFVKDM